jgi:hypothetical protein
MAESGHLKLSLKISGGGYEDLFPYELVLEEGFSAVCRAELTALTVQPHPRKELAGLLDRAVTLGVSQGFSGGLATRSRYFHGILTGIASPGTVSSGERSNCYRHILTIESPLARLRHTRHTRPYYRRTPPDIIEEILAQHQIKGQFADSFVDRSSYSKNLKFDQENASDLEFIRHLMDLYGLSWTGAHGPAAQNGLGSAELYFTEGRRFPRPFYGYSDKRKIPDVESFDFVKYDEKRGVWKLGGWRMEETIGVEGMEINAPYPETNRGSREWRWGETGPGKRCHSYNSLFHDYERGIPAAEIDGDLHKILEARRLSLLSARNNWSGRAEHVGIMPGLLFEVGHFYGGADAERFTALARSTRLHARALWPADMAALPEDGETGELAEVAFDAVDWGKDAEKRFCGLPAKQ